MWASVTTESAHQLLFRSIDAGPFRQLQPANQRQHTRLTRETDGTWIHQDEERRVTRVFSVEGLPIVYRNDRTGREIRITWLNGRPTRIDDSWGLWAYLVTTDPITGYVTALELEGDPALRWTYHYTADRLMRVDP